MLVFLYILFYGFIAITLASLIFTIWGIIKLVKRQCKTILSKQIVCVGVCLTGIFVVVVGSISAFLLYRTYSLPVAEDHENDSIVIVNDTQYILSSRDYSFEENLKPVARRDISATPLTPEWAIELIFEHRYFTNENDDRYLYYPGLMEWTVYEKIEN